MITSRPYSVAYDRSWMMFVDGENLTIRAQEHVKSQHLEIPEGEYHKKNTFIWLPNQHPSGKFFDQVFLANASIRSITILVSSVLAVIGSEVGQRADRGKPGRICRANQAA